MSAEAGPPDLQLSDILRPMSETPTNPAPDTSVAADQSKITEDHTSTPESDEDYTFPRKRLSEMGLLSPDKSDASTREKELVHIILRLTEGIRPDPSQLISQAETISDLCSQRDFLITSIDEERTRWKAEREGWDRISEALFAQARKATRLPNKSREEELERQCASYRSDNHSLRDKLQDTQTRLRALEAELTKLKPLLLLHPFPPSSLPPTLTSASRNTSYMSSLPFPPLSGASAAAIAQKHLDVKQQKKLARDEVKQQDDEGDEPTASTSQIASPSVNSQPSVQPYSHLLPRASSLRTSRHNTRNATAKAASKAPLPAIPLSADARNEHLLLAARKVGRERVGVMVGLVASEKERKKDLEQLRQRERIERERIVQQERDRLPVPSQSQPSSQYYRSDAGGVSPTPKTPRRNHYPPHVGSVGQTFWNTPGRTILPKPVQGQLPVTPEKGKGKEREGGGTNPPTPLDSLLSAARSMMDGEESGKGSRRRASSAMDMPESPLGKKRKLTKNAGDDRTKSALDVLADQAAASRPDGKGKGKAKRKAKTRPPPKDRSALPRKGKAAPRMISPAEPRKVSEPVEDELKGNGHPRRRAQTRWSTMNSNNASERASLGPVTEWGTPTPSPSTPQEGPKAGLMPSATITSSAASLDGEGEVNPDVDDGAALPSDALDTDVVMVQSSEKQSVKGDKESARDASPGENDPPDLAMM